MISFSGCINEDNTTNTLPKSNENPTNTGVINQNTHKTISTNPDDYKSWIPGNPKIIQVGIVKEIDKAGGIVFTNKSLSFFVGVIYDKDSAGLWRFARDEYNATPEVYYDMETKYKKQYEQWHQLHAEIQEWANKNLIGKPVVFVIYPDGDYKVLYNGGRELDKDLILKGYDYISPEASEYNTHAYIENNKINSPAAGFYKHQIDLCPLQEEAKKNKRGVWAIEFNNTN
jgi:hypothetical protein